MNINDQLFKNSLYILIISVIKKKKLIKKINNIDLIKKKEKKRKRNINFRFALLETEPSYTK